MANFLTRCFHSISEGLHNMFTKDIGIDLGTANTLVYMKGRGIIMREPSVVAVDTRTEELRVRSVGREAKAVIGRAPGSIVAVRPLKDGVIADFDITAAMLQSFIRQACGRRWFARPRVVICVPSGVTEVERRAVRQAAARAGARQVTVIEEPMAAAIGAGLPTTDPVGSMIVDIGGGTAEVGHGAGDHPAQPQCIQVLAAAAALGLGPGQAVHRLAAFLPLGSHDHKTGGPAHPGQHRNVLDRLAGGVGHTILKLHIRPVPAQRKAQPPAGIKGQGGGLQDLGGLPAAGKLLLGQMVGVAAQTFSTIFKHLRFLSLFVIPRMRSINCMRRGGGIFGRRALVCKNRHMVYNR